MTGMTVKILTFLGVCGVLAAGAFWYGGSEGVAVISPVRGAVVDAVYATGTVEPVVMMPIAPRSPGRITELLADEGQDVKKGEILAQLEDEDLQKTLTELKARAELAQKEFERKKPLVKNGAVSVEVLDKTKADFEAASAALERAQVNLNYMKLIAPESGQIIRREGEVGEYIPVNQAVFWMSCCSGLRITAEVDEEDIALVHTGQKVVISADAFPDEILEGTVQAITPKGDPVARSYRVRVSLPGDTKLMIGMTAETNIVIDEKQDVLLIPVTALRDGKVLLVQGGKVVEQKVETGIVTPEAAEILSGLKEGDQIVQDAGQDFKNGNRVNAVLKKWNGS